MIIYIILKSSTAVTAPVFSPKSPASTGGRLDLVLRAIMEAFCLNDHHVNNVIFYAILAGPPNPPLTLEINKKLFLSNMKSKINERTLAKVFLSVLKGEEILGISVYRADLKNILKKLLENQVKMYYLHERGKNIDCSIFNHDRVGFILGDQRG
ncbi:MAG TPA: hypothetical protein ENF87_03290, partial [Thermoproteales archaeon]|nr:hypothetical protein [Thermoproteales archaeon]